MRRRHFRVGGCVRVKYLRKPSPLFQLPHELLSGGAAIFIPPDCILLSFSNENFKKSHHEAKSCRTDTAFSHKPGPDRRFGRMRSCQQPRGADRLCREFAAAAFAAFAASLLQAAARVGGSSSKTYTLSLSYEVCSFGSIVTACGISILRHAAFIMFVDRGHR